MWEDLALIATGAVFATFGGWARIGFTQSAERKASRITRLRQLRVYCYGVYSIGESMRRYRDDRPALIVLAWRSVWAPTLEPYLKELVAALPHLHEVHDQWIEERIVSIMVIAQQIVGKSDEVKPSDDDELVKKTATAVCEWGADMAERASQCRNRIRFLLDEPALTRKARLLVDSLARRLLARRRAGETQEGSTRPPTSEDGPAT